MRQIAVPYASDKRYFWADSTHAADPEGEYFVGRYHIAEKTGRSKWLVQRNDLDLDLEVLGCYGTHVTTAYSREEAETAVRRADTQVIARQSDEQLSLNL